MHHHNVVVTRLLFDPIDGIKCNPTWQYTATMHITQPLSYRNTRKKNLNKNKQKKIKARTHSHLFCYVRNGSEREIEKMKQTQHSTAKRDGAESRCSVAFGKNISNMHLLACNQLHKKMLWFAFPYFGLMLLSPAFGFENFEAYLHTLQHRTPNTDRWAKHSVRLVGVGFFGILECKLWNFAFTKYEEIQCCFSFYRRKLATIYEFSLQLTINYFSKSTKYVYLSVTFVPFMEIMLQHTHTHAKIINACSFQYLI